LSTGAKQLEQLSQATLLAGIAGVAVQAASPRAAARHAHSRV
jgi:hypothetical protein